MSKVLPIKSSTMCTENMNLNLKKKIKFLQFYSFLQFKKRVYLTYIYVHTYVPISNIHMYVGICMYM